MPKRKYPTTTITDADREAFVQAVSHVKPLAATTRLPLQKSHPVLRRAATPLPEKMHTLSDSEHPVPPYFMRNGLQQQQQRALRQGHIRITASLDLHGCHIAQARDLCSRFISNCQQQHYRYVHIIHGKGLRSPAGHAVLKQLVGNWLQQMPEVLAFAPAQACDGGSGATYVLLKRIR